MCFCMWGGMWHPGNLCTTAQQGSALEDLINVTMCTSSCSQHNSKAFSFAFCSKGEDIYYFFCLSAFSFPIPLPKIHCEVRILAFRIVLFSLMCHIIRSYEGGLTLNMFFNHGTCSVLLWAFFFPVVLIRIFAILLVIFIFLLCFIYFDMSEVI